MHAPPENDWEIDVETAAAWLRAAAAGQDEAVRLVDCREESEFAHCRIEGATLVPLSRFAEAVAAWPVSCDEIPIIVYCHHGMRSLSATRFLRQKGHRRVWSLHGGIDAWSALIDPGVPRY